jgi:hypothetical protein
MITLGIGELVWSMSLMLPEFFGGEGGITGNRVVGKPVLGISFGPQMQVYYLIAVYCFVCTAAMFAFTRTPLGRMLNAVRDNPSASSSSATARSACADRLHDLGLLRRHRGRLAALNFEIVTAEVVGAPRSGAYLLFTFLGGATFFFGPIIGAVLMVLRRRAVRADQGLAAVPRPRLPVHGDVRAGRHREPVHDEPAARRRSALRASARRTRARGERRLAALAGAAR